MYSNPLEVVVDSVVEESNDTSIEELFPRKSVRHIFPLAGTPEAAP